MTPKCEGPLSNFAFNFNLRRYSEGSKGGEGGEGGAAAAAAEGEAATPGGLSVKTAGGDKSTPGGPKTPRTPKAGLSSWSVVAAAKASALATAHAIVLTRVDPALAAAADPAAAVASMAMLPVLRRGLMSAAGSLLAGINPVPPRGKSLTLEEYKVRQGIE